MGRQMLGRPTLGSAGLGLASASLPTERCAQPTPSNPANRPIRSCVGSNRWELRQPEEQSTKPS